MFVCLQLIQIHISEPIGTKLCTHLPRGLEEYVGYVWAHNISSFPPFRPILAEASANLGEVDGCRRHATPLPASALYPWCGVYGCDVTHGGLCNENAEKWTEFMCVKMETWWDGKEATNEMHLQLHCIYANDNVKPILPSSVLLPFPVYGQHILNLSRRSLTGWQHSAANPESHVCVCVGSPCVYIPSSTFSACFVLSGKCFVNGKTTLWSVLFTWATVRCMLESRKP
jgi:hypothetical protein